MSKKNGPNSKEQPDIRQDNPTGGDAVDARPGKKAKKKY